jgi:AcrR family transcriptional regulator
MRPIPGGPAPFDYFSDFIEGRRGQILDAALAVFGEKGYEAGTMREIAARVGVSEPALYRHYESKEAILADIVATAGDRISGEMGKMFAVVNGENLVEMLHAFISVRRGDADLRERIGAADFDADLPSGLSSGPGGVIHILFHAAPHNDTLRGLFRAHLGRPMVASVRALIPRVDADYGITRPDGEVESRVRMFMSLFAGYFTTSLVFDEGPDDDAVVDALLAIMGWTPPAGVDQRETD